MFLSLQTSWRWYSPPHMLLKDWSESTSGWKVRLSSFWRAITHRLLAAADRLRLEKQWHEGRLTTGATARGYTNRLKAQACDSSSSDISMTICRRVRAALSVARVFFLPQKSTCRLWVSGSFAHEWLFISKRGGVCNFIHHLEPQTFKTSAF